MSALDRPTMDKSLEVISAAEEELNNLCQGKRKFTMCVPVQGDDTDIVIGNALYIGRQLHAEVERLREALIKIATSTQQAYDYDRIGSGEFEDKYPDWVGPDPDMFMDAAIQANETARAELEVK